MVHIRIIFVVLIIYTNIITNITKVNYLFNRNVNARNFIITDNESKSELKNSCISLEE